MDDLVPRIVMECYDNGTSASDCAKRLAAAGFDGYTWQSVADMYEEIYVALECK